MSVMALTLSMSCSAVFPLRGTETWVNGSITVHKPSCSAVLPLRGTDLSKLGRMSVTASRIQNRDICSGFACPPVLHWPYETLHPAPLYTPLCRLVNAVGGWLARPRPTDGVVVKAAAARCVPAGNVAFGGCRPAPRQFPFQVWWLPAVLPLSVSVAVSSFRSLVNHL